MKTLTFYPHRSDGSAPVFCFADIASPTEEVLFARQLFDTHDSAVTVEVFEDQTLLRRYRREDVGARPAKIQSLSRP